MVEALLVEALLFGALSILSSASESKFMRALSLATLIMAYVLTLISAILIWRA